MKALAYPAIPLAAASCFMAWAVRGRASSVFAPSVWRGPGERRVLALTFDDGPSEGTPEILEILALHDGRDLRAKPDIAVTVEAVQRLVPLLLERGYKLETVSRLLCPTI